MKKKKLKLFPKLVMLIFVVYAVMTLLVLQPQLNKGREKNADLEAQVLQQKTANSALSEAIASEPDDADIRRIAREKFGLVDPGEIVFVDISR